MILTIDRAILRKTIAYDVLLSLVYSWSVCQAYIYDAKLETALVIYILTYGTFLYSVTTSLSGSE